MNSPTKTVPGRSSGEETASWAAWGLHLAGPVESAGSRVRALRLILLVHAPLEIALYGLRWQELNAYNALLFSGALATCLVAVVLGIRTRLATGSAALLQGSIILWLFPRVSNHVFLIFFCLLILTLFDPDDPQEATLGLLALRWTGALVLFHSGLQKLLYGTYFRGEFLALTFAYDERFRGLFALLMPAAEENRLLAHAADPSHGSWGFEIWYLILLSNLVYLFELAAPLGLLVERFRSWTLVAVLLFFVAIEAGARELLFGLFFANLILLFSRRDHSRVTVPLTLTVYALLLLVRIGWLPNWRFN